MSNINQSNKAAEMGARAGKIFGFILALFLTLTILTGLGFLVLLSLSMLGIYSNDIGLFESMSVAFILVFIRILIKGIKK